MSSTPADTARHVHRELGVTAPEWEALSRTCQTLSATVSDIAARARSARAATANRRLDAASIATFNEQRRNAAAGVLWQLQQRVSTSAWINITKFISDLKANTQSARLGK